MIITRDVFFFLSLLNNSTYFYSLLYFDLKLPDFFKSLSKFDDFPVFQRKNKKLPRHIPSAYCVFAHTGRQDYYTAALCNSYPF